ncbi:MAG: HEAT repeat domain-containing protein [Deferribacterales bacterium]
MDKQTLLNSLRNPDEAERIYAVEDVLADKDESLYPVLIEHLYHEDSRLVRELIVEAFKVLDISAYFRDIAKYFESSDAYVRNCAIEIFGSKGEDSVAYLTSIMDHSNKEVRKLVLDSLVATSSKYSIPALRAALKDKAPNVMITAIEYLGKIYDEESLADIMEIFENVEEAMVRMSCLETLIIMGQPSTVDRVLTILGGKNMDSVYKPTVLRLVGERGAARHLDFLLSFLNNRNTMYFREIGNAVLKIISRNNIHKLDEEHTKYILQSLNNTEGSTDERLTFFYVISNLDMPGKEALYEELSSDENETISMTSLEYLARTDRDRAIRITENKLKMAEGESRRMLANLLETL